MLTEALRAQRLVVPEPPASPAGTVALEPATPHRLVHDARHGTRLPGERVRGEGEPRTRDAAADEAYDAAGATFACLEQAFGRDSIDGHGMTLVSTVHFGERYDNAFWNGRQMVYGDGDGVVFNGFTSCLDVVGHEFAHGVTQHEAALEYRGESGALNESFSDVLGSIVKQHALGQRVDEADWLIGAGLFTPLVHGVAIRSMRAPGTAYDDPRLGRDPQVAHMRDYVHTFEDQGGVHLNSGIPNHAFYLAARALGGHVWERAGVVWYAALCMRLHARSTFADAAAATLAEADEHFGATAAEQVRGAWAAVGVTPTAGEVTRAA